MSTTVSVMRAAPLQSGNVVCICMYVCLHVCVSFTVVLTVQDPAAAVKKNRLNFSLWHGVVIC